MQQLGAPVGVANENTTCAVFATRLTAYSTPRAGRLDEALVVVQADVPVRHVTGVVLLDDAAFWVDSGSG